MKRKIDHRIIVPIQAKGSLGKTFETLLRIAWYEDMGVQWQGFDGDNVQRDMYMAYPDRVFMLCPDADLNRGHLNAALMAAADAPLTLIDPRAHHDDVILASFLGTGVQQHLEDIGAKITVVLFPNNDHNVIQNIADVAQALDKSVDYLLVRNRARAQDFQLWESSSTLKTLRDFGAKEITIEALGPDEHAVMAYLNVQFKRGMAFTDLANPKWAMAPVTLGTIQDFLHKVNVAYDEVAEILLPDSEIGKIKKGTRHPNWERVKAEVGLVAPRAVRGAGKATVTSAA